MAKKINYRLGFFVLGFPKKTYPCHFLDYKTHCIFVINDLNRMNRKNITYGLAAMLVLLFVVGYLQKDNINDLIARGMSENMDKGSAVSTERAIANRYNYTQNGLDYDFTLLEFGADGCAICKRMEPVLETLSNSKAAKINVVFLHTMDPANRELIEYYGISAIPMQVLLNKTGEKFYKHYGFISSNEIIAKILDAPHE